MRRAASVLVSLALAALALSAPTAGAATPGPSVETPPSAGSAQYWGSSGPLVGNGAGTLMGDATVRLTSDPATPLAVTGAAAALVVATGPRLDGDGAVPAVTADDTDAVGSLVTATSASTVAAVLWSVDLGTAASRSRSVVDLPIGTMLVGATAHGWVTTSGAGQASLWPFDGSASRPVTLPADARTLAADSAGIVALSSSPASRLLRVAPDLVTTTTLRDWGATAMPAPGALRISGAGGRLAWWRSDIGELGYVDGAAAPLTITGVALRSVRPVGLVVLPGTVLVVSMTTFASPNACDGLLTWTVGGGVAAQDRGTWPSAQTCTFWPSAAADGHAVVDALLTFRTAIAYEPQYESWWAQWNGPTSFASRVAPGPVPAAQLVAAVGTLGHVLTAYDTFAAPHARVEMVAPIAGTPVVASTSRVLGRVVPFLAASGARWVVVESSTDRSAPHGLQLVVRDGMQETARIPVRSGTPVAAGRVGSLTMSGPFTSFLDLGVDEATQDQFAVHVIGPDGSTVATVPQIATFVAQDGQYVAYATTRDHSLWLLDTAQPRSRTNPRLVYGPCPVRTCGTIRRVLLSSGFLVAATSLPDGSARLIVADLAHRTVRSFGIGARTCDAMTARVVACRTTTTRAVQLLDVATRGARFVSVGITSGIPVSFAGRALVSSGSYDPREGYTTTARITALPATVLRVGAPRLLGPWSANGAVASRQSRAWWWRPQWSFTDRVDRWVLALRTASGRVVRTWTGTAVDGVVRGVVWNGRTSSGQSLPPGTYRWTLAGRGPSGAVVATTGTGVAAGTVRLATQVRGRVVLAVPATVAASASKRVAVVGRLTAAATGASLAGRKLVLLVLRPGARGYASLGDCVSDAAGRCVWQTTLPARGRYAFLLRHVGDPVATSASASLVVRAR